MNRNVAGFPLSLSVPPWEKVGDERLIAEHFGRQLFAQGWRNPHTGEVMEFSGFRGKSWASVLAVKKDLTVVVAAEFQQGLNQVSINPFGGTLKPGEKPAAAIARELEEESGLRAQQCVHLGQCPLTPRSSDTVCDLFLALGCEVVNAQKLDHGEHIEIIEMPLVEFLVRVYLNQIFDWCAVAAAYLAQPYLPEGVVAEATMRVRHLNDLP